MDEFSWSRVGKALAEAVGYAEGVRAMIVRVLAWLMLLGFPLAARFVVPEQYLPQPPFGIALWAGSILVAFTLSVRAIYVKQREVDVLTSAENRTRLEQRRAVWAAIETMALEYSSLRRSLLRRQRNFQARTRQGATKEDGERFAAALEAYWAAANLLPMHEKLVHSEKVGHFRKALEEQLGRNLAHKLESLMLDLRSFQAWQLGRMDRVMQEVEEARILHAYLKAKHPEWAE